MSDGAQLQRPIPRGELLWHENVTLALVSIHVVEFTKGHPE